MARESLLGLRAVSVNCEQFAHVPEELRLKRIEVNRAETRVHNFVEFAASGRATPALADALVEAPGIDPKAEAGMAEARDR